MEVNGQLHNPSPCQDLRPRSSSPQPCAIPLSYPSFPGLLVWVKNFMTISDSNKIWQVCWIWKYIMWSSEFLLDFPNWPVLQSVKILTFSLLLAVVCISSLQLCCDFTFIWTITTMEYFYYKKFFLKLPSLSSIFVLDTSPTTFWWIMGILSIPVLFKLRTTHFSSLLNEANIHVFLFIINCFCVTFSTWWNHSMFSHNSGKFVIVSLHLLQIFWPFWTLGTSFILHWNTGLMFS